MMRAGRTAVRPQAQGTCVKGWVERHSKPMHASIRRYEYAGAPLPVDELVQVGREIAAHLSQAPGFVSFLILSAARQGPGPDMAPNQGLATVSIFEDQPGLEQADRVAAALLDERLAAGCRQQAGITRGEIVFQRGL